MADGKDTGQTLVEQAQEIVQQTYMLILRVRNLTGILDDGAYSEYFGSFDRIQKLFDQFSHDFRDAGFPDDPEIREARGKLSDCFQEFFQTRTGFFNQYAARSAEPAPEIIPEDTPENAGGNDAEEQDAEEVIDVEAEPEEEPEVSEDSQKKKKRRVKKPLSTAEQTRQEAQRAEAARMGIPVRQDQPVTEADLRNAQYRLEEERQRRAAAAAENIRQENEKLAAYRQRMAQSAGFQHLENSHIDMSREGIGHTRTEQEDASQESERSALAAVAVSSSVAAAVQKEEVQRQDNATHTGQEQRREKTSREPGSGRISQDSSRTDIHKEPSPRQRYHLCKITTNLGAVSYVAFIAAAQKTAQEVSRDNDTVSGLLSASYYVPAAAGLAWAAAHNPTKPLERSARRITPDEMARNCKDTIRSYERLKAQKSGLEKQLASLSGTDKLAARRRGQIQEQLSALNKTLPAAERAAAQSRRIQQFRHERNMDRELANRLKVNEKMPKGAKAISERSQGILRKDNRALVKKHGALSGLSEKEIRNRVQRLTMEGKAQKLQILQLESKGAALSSAERQLLKKLKEKSAATGKEISSLVGLSRAKSDLAYKSAKLRSIQNTASKRYMYRLNGMRLVRSFALRPLYFGQDSNTEGLAYMTEFAVNPTTWHITKKAVTLPFRVTGKVVRRVAPKFANNVQVKIWSAKKKLHHVVTAPKRAAAWTIKKAGATISSSIPVEVKTRVTAPVRYVKGKYNAAKTAYTGAKKWLAGTRVGKAWTNVQISGKQVSALGHMAFGVLRKGVLIGLGVYLGLVLMIGVIGVIMPTAESSACLILSTAPSNTGKINLSPYCQIIRMEKLRYNDMISQLVERYEEDEHYDNVELSYSGPDNLREMLSMMAVRLGQNLDKDNNPEVEKYLKALYRSSRPYSVYEHEYECSGCKTRVVQKVSIDPVTGEPSLQMELESYCPGHIDVSIRVTILSFDEIFAADTYTIPNDGWEGWTEESIAWCKAIYDTDWAELYEGVSLSTAPLFGSLVISENERKIWDYLLALTSNPYGAAGLMGNLYAESGLRSNNLQDEYEPLLGYDDTAYTQAVDDGTYLAFTNDSAGYGLAQWTYHTRKEKLLAFASTQGRSIGDLSMQLQFLSRELTGTDVLETLRTATTVRDASDKVLTDFENPADQSETVRSKRASLGEYYYNTFVLGINAEGVLTQAQLDVIRVATNSENYNIRAWDGYCQRWAAQVYAVAGLPLDGSCCAYHSGVRYGVSDDWSIIPPGAAVYGYAGNKYGHVGIYVGNGLVYHNLGGDVLAETLRTWVQKYDGFCWGWEAGTDLTQYPDAIPDEH